MPVLLKLEPHRDCWSSDFTSEALLIEKALGQASNTLHHIGSTAISGILAKPTIDILAEVTSLEAVDARSVQMRKLGYEVMREFGIPGRRYFRKDDASGYRTHQIHAFIGGSAHLERHLAFRDYLRAHPDVASVYSRLKSDLAGRCDGDLARYMDGKDPFIRQTEAEALLWYRQRGQSGTNAAASCS